MVATPCGFDSHLAHHYLQIYMIPVTELRNGTTFKQDADIFEVVSYQHIKMGRGSANIKIRARNLKTGQLSEKTFISGARVDEASTEKKKLQYLYKDAENLVFMDPKTFEQFPVKETILGGKEKFLKESSLYDVLTSEEVVLGVEMPKLMDLAVAETGPGVRGDTVSNVYKPATLENGLTINVPLFIKNGDRIKIDTRSNQYVERAK